MAEPENEIANRLSRLEKSNRGWKLFFSITIAALTSIAVLGARPAGTAESIDAREIVLSDQNGKPRIIMSVTDRGPVIEFKSRAGTTRLLMGLVGGPGDEGAPYVNFCQASGMARFTMGVTKEVTKDGNEDEHPYWTLHNKRGLPRLSMGTESDCASFLNFDADNPGVNAPADGARVLLGESRLALGVDEEGTPFLITRDKNGREVRSGFESRTRDGKGTTP